MFSSWDYFGDTWYTDHILELQLLGTAIGAQKRARCECYYGTLSGLCEALIYLV